MPRKPKDPNAPPTQTKTGRQRKSKKDQQAAAAAALAAETVKHEYEPMGMGTANGMMIMDESGMYTHDAYGHYYGQPQNGFEGHMGYAAPSGHNQVPPSAVPQPPTSQNNIIRQPPNPGIPQPAPAHMHPLPTPSPIEFRIHDMNRRFFSFLTSGILEKDYAQWWDAFSHEFFDEDAKMTFVLLDANNKPAEKYMIGRQLIPRYFRTLLEGGMNELYYVIKGPAREAPTPEGLISYECNHFMLVSKHDRPYPSEVQTDCSLKLELTQFDEVYNYRIKSWHIELQPSQEFSYNDLTREFSVLELPEGMPKRPITYGMSPNTLQTLKICVVLEPMQMIMSTCKASPAMAPTDALRRICFNRQQQSTQSMFPHQPPHMMPQPQQEEPPKPKAARKRTRKANPNPKNAKKNTASPAPVAPGFPPPTGVPPTGLHYNQMPVQDVLLVSEPSLLGGDFQEDERQISKLENPHYDPNHHGHPGAMQHNPGLMAIPPTSNGGPPPGQTMGMQPAPHLGMMQMPPGGPGGPPQMTGPPPMGLPPQQNGVPGPPNGFEYLGGWPRLPAPTATNPLIA